MIIQNSGQIVDLLSVMDENKFVNRRHLVYIMKLTFPSSPPSEREDSRYEKLQSVFYSRIFRHPSATATLPDYEFLWITRIHLVIKSQPPREGLFPTVLCV